MAASTSTAATSRRSNSRLPTTLNARDQPPAEVSDQRVSGLTGAVHSDALMKTFGPDWVPNDYGLKIERAIDAYLETWPIYR
ncbi:hypothetical protein [Mycobacterium tuberculosis]|uniref:hypothetical protein n=1 Tax=Mycobacterium tuberculosis TaxID=1773 RepID=UPI001F20D37E|nr:hypothetical protein [Mycobacterium tuberculosis]